MSYDNYVDLRPGWRIRVITPILKSGGYKPQLKETAASGGAVELSADDDFVGYETAYYSVNSNAGRGIAVRFLLVEDTVKGESSRRPRPRVDLFSVLAGSGFVRVVFLTRVSQSDHNQAILVATSSDILDARTRRLEADPSANCQSDAESKCVWVPEGIAVRPEKRDPEHRKNWIAAM